MRILPTRGWVFPTICLMITGYFIYHGIQGSRGYRRMIQLNKEIALANFIAEDIREERTLLKTKVRALSPQSLDLDQLEESALRILNMGQPDVRVIFTDPKKS